MGQDNQPKARQARQLVRRKAQRASYDRILIVSEGSKTEPLYFNEIRVRHRLHTANVQVRYSEFGTQPLQVVGYAHEIFLRGDLAKNIQVRAFEQVYAVFDRDDHDTYHAALGRADALNGKLLNDLGQSVKFQAVPSVPFFELWLLLHFEEVLAPLHRTEVYERLRQHLVGYEKGHAGHFEATRELLDVANERATHLAETNNPRDGDAPYTGIHLLVNLLTMLKFG
ncbi:MAG: RloB domain-containing protein [Betaproteobacteria bacterium]|nr:RloB domain-containing protein [Betaproteobacteria bacterium]